MVIRARDRTMNQKSYKMQTPQHHSGPSVCTFLVLDSPWDQQTLSGLLFRIHKLQIHGEFPGCSSAKNSVRELFIMGVIFVLIKFLTIPLFSVQYREAMII